MLHKQTLSWSDWESTLKKSLYDRIGDNVLHLFNDIHSRDYFHDMYQRGLSPLDALQQYLAKGVPKNDQYRIA